jgi:hypothetical protein
MMKEKKVNVAKLIYNGNLMGYRVSAGGKVFDLSDEDYTEFEQSVPRSLISCKDKLALYLRDDGVLVTYNEHGVIPCDNWVDAFSIIKDKDLLEDKVYIGVQKLSALNETDGVLNKDILKTIQVAFDSHLRFYILPRPIIKKEQGTYKSMYHLGFKSLYEACTFIYSFASLNGVSFSRESAMSLTNCGSSCGVIKAILSMSGYNRNRPRYGFNSVTLTGSVKRVDGAESGEYLMKISIESSRGNGTDVFVVTLCYSSMV